MLLSPLPEWHPANVGILTLLLESRQYSDYCWLRRRLIDSGASQREKIMPRPLDPDPATQAMVREFLFKRKKLVEPRPLINPRPKTDDRAPLSFSQERLWFLSQLKPGTPYYNLSILLHVSGPLNRQVLASSCPRVCK